MSPSSGTNAGSGRPGERPAALSGPTSARPRRPRRPGRPGRARRPPGCGAGRAAGNPCAPACAAGGAPTTWTSGPRVADLAHARRIAEALHPLADDLQDLALPRREARRIRRGIRERDSPRPRRRSRRRRARPPGRSGRRRYRRRRRPRRVPCSRSFWVPPGPAHMSPGHRHLRKR
jgi:hypothetical protein